MLAKDSSFSIIVKLYPSLYAENQVFEKMSPFCLSHSFRYNLTNPA